MKDQYGRSIDYLRVSVTDRCNLRCVYCMPKDGVEWIPDEEILTDEEIHGTVGMDTSSIKNQDGEPDKASKELAGYLTKKLYYEVDAENIVSTGKEIRSAPFSYMVDSWEVTKTCPGEGQRIDREEVQCDENGTITNEYSYVVANLTVENLNDMEVTQHIWGFLRLKIRGAEDVYVGEVDQIIYSENNVVKEKNKNTYEETFAANEEKRVRLVYVVSDDLLLNTSLYLSINPNGMAEKPLEEGEVETKRWILLN